MSIEGPEPRVRFGVGDFPDEPDLRVRFGVGRFPDGYNVVIEVDGRPIVFDPTFATEAEAQAASSCAAADFRRDMARPGLRIDHTHYDQGVP